ncbi:hypothetical protein [Tenacibaculum aiptasiae]|uniref:hypothetical protein n=1 Tax=Tenacibaculum aiptasiae TaxID=426481 RepID=UPI00232FAC03|nr:hypothetical protein [Tenacibaculum aiptasiae]
MFKSTKNQTKKENITSTLVYKDELLGLTILKFNFLKILQPNLLQITSTPSIFNKSNDCINNLYMIYHKTNGEIIAIKKI